MKPTSAAFESLYPFESHFFETDGARMHYVDEGPKDAPPIVMLHGNPTWSFFYRELIRSLRGDYRVIAPDHIGYGLSDKPQEYPYTLATHVQNIDALIEELSLSDITLVVHDWGGAIGMGFAVKKPHRIKRLVVFSTAAFPADRIPLSIDVCRLPGIGAFLIRGLNAFARAALVRCIYHKERITDEVRAGYLAPYDSWANRIANLRFVQDIPMDVGHPGYEFLMEIGDRLSKLQKHPMLIIWGGKDFVFNDFFFNEWKARFPEAETHYIEDAGHYVLEDAHERAVKWIRSFLKEHAS